MHQLQSSFYHEYSFLYRAAAHVPRSLLGMSMLAASCKPLHTLVLVKVFKISRKASYVKLWM